MAGCGGGGGGSCVPQDAAEEYAKALEWSSILDLLERRWTGHTHNGIDYGVWQKELYPYNVDGPVDGPDGYGNFVSIKDSAGNYLIWTTCLNNYLRVMVKAGI